MCIYIYQYICIYMYIYIPLFYIQHYRIYYCVSRLDLRNNVMLRVLTVKARWQGVLVRSDVC